MQLTFNSVSDLEQALRRAAAAHGEHEKEIGHEDADWPTWYAQYMAKERTEGEGLGSCHCDTGDKSVRYRRRPRGARR